VESETSSARHGTDDVIGAYQQFVATFAAEMQRVGTVLAKGMHDFMQSPSGQYLKAVVREPAENHRDNGWSNRDHCSRGHEYTEANTRWRQRAPLIRVRECRACDGERQAASKARRRAP
jgi:hypothetical protein